MDRLRPRERHVFSGFTKAEVIQIEKMEKLLKESGEQLLNREFCQKIAQSFNRSSGRAGKPIVKWTEVHSWFQNQQQDAQDASKNMHVLPKACPPNRMDGLSQMPQDSSKAGERIPELSELEFEAKSSKDAACRYDVDMFVAHRFLGTDEVEVRVRFVGFGAEEDEWLNVKKVRQRSVPLEHSECHTVKVGDIVLCFQERRDQAIYYDARVLEIQRRLHDIRGCRCLFLIQYDHDNTEASIVYQNAFIFFNCATSFRTN
ncbi:protein SAWADEE HOMEODOMAIN HOMOLOG 1-like isoform X3 [Alnus glutinosa]|uniref:protein SAWADEE HOMEODOMAIN HOMOLOG 1-like isoform X3 n=1 Tax=Alnus glutinosa TaxID=3517 RepID=UPI002D790565|nr:protein SAWADEE HOMEODOMAIN HOMOLOG 1-like isoform X3 [Alnus glutinosa]